MGGCVRRRCTRWCLISGNLLTKYWKRLVWMCQWSVPRKASAREYSVKTISVVTPCFNEAENVRELHERIRAVMRRLAHYRYEHIFIDNASRDNTVGLLKELAASDKNVKVIVNTRNFGHIRSPFHAIQQ